MPFVNAVTPGRAQPPPAIAPARKSVMIARPEPLCPPIGISVPGGSAYRSAGLQVGFPVASSNESAGSFTPLLRATLTLPSASAEVAASKIIGLPLLTGIPIEIGLVE